MFNKRLRQAFKHLLITGLFPVILLTGNSLHLKAFGYSIFNPANPAENGVQNLVYGASSPWDVQKALGRMPDDVIKSEQMWPVIENHYYYEEGGNGAATIFVFENGMLVGMHYKSPKNQLIDLTYFLPNMGDRRLNAQMLQGYAGYYPQFLFVESESEY